MFLSFILGCFVVVAQMMTQRIIGSPRKRSHEDLHLQSCGALSSSPSMRRPKHLPQTTSASTNPLDSPSSEQSLECKETILWPLSQQRLGSELWGHFRLQVLQPLCAVQQMSVESLIQHWKMIYFHSVTAAKANWNGLYLLVPCETVPSHQQKW